MSATEIPPPPLSEDLAPRLRAIDACRGVAVVLMVISHPFRLLAVPRLYDVTLKTGWGQLMLALKPSASMFFLCFGLMVGMIYTAPHRSFGKKPALRLMRRGLEVFVAYKLLLILELLARGFTWPRIVPVLLYQKFASWTEILNFYAIVLTLSPLLIWTWRRLPVQVQFAIPALLWGATEVVRATSPWPGAWGTLEVILAGRQGFYIFPILPWLIPVTVGVLLGERVPALAKRGKGALLGTLFGLAGLSLIVYVWACDAEIYRSLTLTAQNVLKHPPRLTFLSVTLAAAFVIMAGAFGVYGVQKEPPSATNPLEVLGRHSLLIFNIHFAVTFLYIIYKHNLERVAPGEALGLSVLLVVFVYLCSLVREKIPDGGGV